MKFHCFTSLRSTLKMCKEINQLGNSFQLFSILIILRNGVGAVVSVSALLMKDGVINLFTTIKVTGLNLILYFY